MEQVGGSDVWAKTVVLVVAVLCAACGGVPVPVAYPPLVDVETQNLEPAEEIAALLKGSPGDRRPGDLVRVAVVPFRVRDKAAPAAMGESVSEIISARLSASERLSVLPRAEVEALERAPGDPASATGAGELKRVAKELGIRHVVFGFIRATGLRSWSIDVRRLVADETDEIAPSTVSIGEAEWEGALGPTADEIAKGIAPSAGSTINPTLPPLTAERAELAARAQHLQYEGKLVEAQDLYQKALEQPSSAWRFEAEYVRLMTELGMDEWVLARVSSLLLRMPAGQGTACIRSRLATDRARASGKMRDARAAVRIAASCGDQAVMAMALVAYAGVAESVHFPLAKAALAQAEDILGKTGGNAWVSCALRFMRLWWATDLEGDRGGDPSANYQSASTECEAAGHLRLASLDAQNAGSLALHPHKATPSYRRAVELAEPVGGVRYTNVLLAIAGHLRKTGQPTKADDRILELMRTHLSAIVEIHGGLPPIEKQLDDDLLKRIDISTRGPAQRVPDPLRALVVKFHRRQLGTGLRAWATSTRLVSQRQAAFYDSVADQLTSTTAAPAETADQRLERRMKEAGVPLAKVQGPGDAILWGESADLNAAQDALEARFFELLGEKGSMDRLRVLAEAARQVARWHASPVQRRRAAEMTARVLLSSGASQEALAMMRGTRVFATDDPWWHRRILAFEIQVLGKASAADASKKRWESVGLAKVCSDDAWVDELYDASFGDMETQILSYEKAGKKLLDAADELEKDKAWMSAARALEKAASLFTYGQSASGSTEAVEAYARRARILKNLNDRARFAEGLADVLLQVRNLAAQNMRGGLKQALQYGIYSDLVELPFRAVRVELNNLVAGGRVREALRIATRLPDELMGMEELAQEALQWSERIMDSAEYPWIMAQLHSMRAHQVDDGNESRSHFLKARAFFEHGEYWWHVLVTQSKTMKYAPNEAQLWADYDDCLRLAEKGPDDREECTRGLGLYVGQDRRLDQRDRLTAALKRGIEDLALSERAYDLEQRWVYRTNLAALAALAENWTVFDEQQARVKEHYTVTSPEAYQWGTHLSRVITPVGDRDPKRAVSLMMEFADLADGVSDYYKADVLYGYADIARRAGDLPAERHFLDVGRQCAERSTPRLLWYYEIYPIGRLFEQSVVSQEDWKVAAAIYEGTASVVRKQYSDNPYLAEELELSRALCLSWAGQAAAGAKLAAAQVAALESNEDSFASRPCYATKLLEAAASLAMTEGTTKSCTTGERFRKLADQWKERCSKKQCLETGGGSRRWCDLPASKAWARNPCKKAFDADKGLVVTP